jgi:hypothetical protein
MEPPEVFSKKIRWLAVATGFSTGALCYFWSPVAAFLPTLVPLIVLSQSRFSDFWKSFVKWLLWIWALAWTQGLFALCILLLNDSNNGRNLIALRVASLSSGVLVVWLDIELLVDAVGRIRSSCSAEAHEPTPVGVGLWIFAGALNLWMVSGLAAMIGIYHAVAGQLYSLVLSIVEGAIVLVFDVYLIHRALKWRRIRRSDVPV